MARRIMESRRRRDNVFNNIMFLLCFFFGTPNTTFRLRVHIYKIFCRICPFSDMQQNEIDISFQWPFCERSSCLTSYGSSDNLTIKWR